MSSISQTFLISIITFLLVSPSLSSKDKEMTGVCLTKDLESLITAGCHFDPKPETLLLLEDLGSQSEDFNLGQATYQEAKALWPTPKYVAGYFKNAIASPNTPYAGEMAAGVQEFGDYTVIGMQNIHVCSDNGKSADYAIYNTQIIIQTSEISKINKEELRNAAWQIGCKNKVNALKKLLSGEDLLHSQIARE
jgi:hypothetical protein